jgi:prephenate dehydrogenase
MHVVGEATDGTGLALTGRGLQDVTRLASSPAKLWSEVSASNADEIGPALDELIRVLGELRDDLRNGEAVERIFESANRWREELQKSKLS